MGRELIKEEGVRVIVSSIGFFESLFNLFCVLGFRVYVFYLAG